jgi:hypothetical protein
MNFLHDLHYGQKNNEQIYVQKMSMSTTNGGLWSDFTIVYCISRYLECPIHVWNKNKGQIKAKKGNQYCITILNIVYGNNHCKKTYKQMW